MVEKNKSHKNEMYIDFIMFKYAADTIINKIKNSNSKYDGIFALPRGGYILGVYLSHRLNLPMVLNITEDTLIVDDIADKGNTLSKYENNDKVVLVAKDEAVQRVDEDLFWVFNCRDDVWCVFWWEEDSNTHYVRYNLPYNLPKVKQNGKQNTRRKK